MNRRAFFRGLALSPVAVVAPIDGDTDNNPLTPDERRRYNDLIRDLSSERYLFKVQRDTSDEAFTIALREINRLRAGKCCGGKCERCCAVVYLRGVDRLADLEIDRLERP